MAKANECYPVNPALKDRAKTITKYDLSEGRGKQIHPHIIFYWGKV